MHVSGADVVGKIARTHGVRLRPRLAASDHYGRALATLMTEERWSDIKKRTAAEHGQLVGEVQRRVIQLKKTLASVEVRLDQPYQIL